MLSPTHTVRDMLELRQLRGCSGVPVTQSGRLGGRLQGIVTSRDIDCLGEGQHGTPLGQVGGIGAGIGAGIKDWGWD